MSEQTPIPDRPGGLVPRERLEALARRVGPSLDAAFIRRPRLVWSLIVLVLAGVGLASFQSVLGLLVHTRKEVAVPDLKGKNLDEALGLLSPLNLSLAKEAVEVDESLPPGAILRQSPPAGMKVREGKTVRVTLASGGQAVFIPDLVGKSLPEAQNQLRAAGLLPGAVMESYSQRYQSGWVMEQVPAAGAVSSRGQMVDLKLSKGGPPEGVLLMPDFVNKPLSQAMAWAGDKNLKAEVREELRSDAAPGLVLAQTPAPDASLDPDDALQFTAVRSTAPAGALKTIRYEVPSGSQRVEVRIVLRDEDAEREIFKGYQEPGSAVEVPVSPRGVARARIFVNGVLIAEKVLP